MILLSIKQNNSHQLPTSIHSHRLEAFQSPSPIWDSRLPYFINEERSHHRQYSRQSVPKDGPYYSRMFFVTERSMHFSHLCQAVVPSDLTSPIHYSSVVVGFDPSLKIIFILMRRAHRWTRANHSWQSFCNTFIDDTFWSSSCWGQICWDTCTFRRSRINCYGGNPIRGEKERRHGRLIWPGASVDCHIHSWDHNRCRVGRHWWKSLHHAAVLYSRQYIDSGKSW